MDKLREQYKAQKDEEETKRLFYHSPATAHRGVDGSESSEEVESALEGSQKSEQTPEPSPAPQQRDIEDRDARQHSEELTPIQTSSAPVPAPKPKPAAPKVAPRPAKATPPPPTTRGAPPQVNGEQGLEGSGSHAYNPYPPPTQAAPPSPKETTTTRAPMMTQQPTPQPVAPPTPPHTSDKEALFAFAWYHGSIARDEALRRLEGVGGFDG